MHLQLLWSRSNPVLLLLATFVVPANEADSDDEDISLFECYPFVLRAGLELIDGDPMSGPRIVRKRVAIASEIFDKIQEDATSADTVLRPV